MADRILGRLPAAAGDAAPPQAPQPAPPVQQQAPRSKQERRMRQQEEEQRRLEEEQLRREEEQQRREERRRRAEAEEAHRETQYNQLVNQDAIRSAMTEFSHAEEGQAMEKAKAFLMTAARTLYARENPAPEAEHTKMVDSYRVLVARHVQNDELAQNFYDMLDAHEQSFRESAEQDQLVHIIGRDVAFIFRNEIEHIPMLRQAMVSLMEETSKQSSKRFKEFSIFEDMVARSLDVQAEPEQDTASVIHTSLYAADLKEDVRIQLRNRVSAAMQEHDLTHEAARRLVLKEMRDTAKRATAISLANGVVHDVSQADMQRHGSASFQQTVTAAQAQTILASSNGFLYGKDVGDGLVELRPTLPETAEINGKTYPLRRDYNLLIKSIVSQLVGEDGKLLEGADEFASDLSYYCYSAFTSFTSERQVDSIKGAAHDAVQNVIKPGLERILGEGQELDSTLARLEDLLFETRYFERSAGAYLGSSILPFEILSAVPEFVSTASKVAAPLEERKQTVRAAMAEDGYSEAEITAQLEALTSMYQDSDAAMEELLKIRRMDPDSPDIPLPNACSANGLFFEGMTKALLPEQLQRVNYFTDSHINADPQSHLDHIRRKNPGIETEGHPLYMGYKNTAEELRTNPSVLSQASKQFLKENTSKDMKYDYHVAAKVGSLEDGTVITVEGFAAETTQLMVSPFSTRGAVGLYRGGQAGMDGYYNLDNPLPTEEGQILGRTKQHIKNLSLPGDPGYTPRHARAADAGGNVQ